MPKLLKIIKTIFYTILIIFLIFISGSLILTKLNTPIQYRIYSIQSGSMEPVLPLGSVIAVLPRDNYQVNDIVTFAKNDDPKNTVTHRIVDISRDEDLDSTSYRTKGDANEDPDRELLRSERVVGKVLFHLPYLGYLVAFAQTQIGLIIMIIIPATLIVYSEVVNIGREIKLVFAKRKNIQKPKEAKKEPSKTFKKNA
jgi:signal peptidase I